MVTYIFKGKITNSIPYVLVLISCIFRITMPNEVITTLSSTLDRLIYLIYPLALWWYLQKIYTFFSSYYIRQRYARAKYFLTRQFLCELLLAVTFSLFLTVINIILYWQFIGSIEVLSFFVDTCSIYILLISIIHLVYILKKDYKISFLVGYSCLFILYLYPLSLLLMSVGITMQLDTVISIVSLFTMLIAFVLSCIYGKKERDFYEDI